MQFSLVVGFLQAIPLVFALDSTVISATDSVDSIGDSAPVGFPQSTPADTEARIFELEEQDINGGVGPESLLLSSGGLSRLYSLEGQCRAVLIGVLELNRGRCHEVSTIQSWEEDSLGVFCTGFGLRLWWLPEISSCPPLMLFLLCWARVDVDVGLP